MSGLTRAELEQLREIGTFAERLIGEPLWPHQLDVARSPARFRTLCSGRQIGKSRTLAVIALHHAFTNPESRVLIISAGDDAAKDLLGEVAGLAQAPLLGASVEEDDSAKVVLSNGSVIRCVPASHRRARGKSIDLLILDEACFIPEEIWDAAKFVILARPGSRVVMASTPYGRLDKFFARHYRMGRDGREGYESWSLPSSVSPLVDQALLAEWAETDAPRIYRREVLAEWVDEAGAYFTSAELDAATVDVELVPPEAGYELGQVVGGVDWGFAQDANTLVVIGALPEPDARGRTRYRVAYVEEAFSTPYADWVDRIVETSAGFRYVALAAETNGVGGMPVQQLTKAMWLAGRGDVVVPTSTTARLKEDAFGFAKLLIQQRRLEIPRCASSLLKQLAGLEFETTESGLTRIAVPDRIGHDDLVMAFALAVLQLQGSELLSVPEQVVSFEDTWSAADEWAFQHDDDGGFGYLRGCY